MDKKSNEDDQLQKNDYSKNIEYSKACYIYLLEGLADWEIGYITAELNTKRYFSKNKNLNLKFVSKNLNPIKTMGGAILEPHIEIDKVKFNDGDMLILPGSDNWDKVDDNILVHTIRNFEKENIIIAAICGATFFLANYGIFNNRIHTSNDLNYLKMVCPNYLGENLYSKNNIASTENLITASSIAALGFSYEVFKKLDVMKNETLEAWYNLYNSQDPKYFIPLMNSL